MLWTADPKLEQDVLNLQKELDLNNDTIEELRKLGLKERLGIPKREWMKKMSEGILSVDEYNAAVNNLYKEIDKETRILLGPKYEDFRKWIRKWYSQEVEYCKRWLEEQRRNPPSAVREWDNNSNDNISDDDLLAETTPLADIEKELVFTTQYHCHSNWEVALPDKYVKFANLVWYIPPSIRDRYSNPPYTINIYYPVTRKSVLNIKVKDVGLWNEDDNYWNTSDGQNPRRLFKDLPLGMLEAEAAYYDNYNNGKDQFGRTVTNPAGIDLTP